MHVQIAGLSKTYRGDVHALTDLTLDLAPGMTGLLGANGAGQDHLDADTDRDRAAHRRLGHRRRP